MDKTKKLETELTEKFYLDVLDKYLSHNIKLFSEYLKNKKRFINFVYRNTKLQEIEDIEKAVCLYKKLDIFSSTDFDKKTTETILIKYYTGKGTDLDLYYFCDKFNYSKEEELILNEKEKENRILECYIKKIQPLYIQPLLKELYPFSKWIDKDNNFSKNDILKNFYQETSKNSFSKAIEEFEDEKSNFLNKNLKKNLHDDFSKFSDEIIDEIRHWYYLLFIGKEDIFSKSRYNQGALNYWIPLLHKSDIYINPAPLARLLVATIKEYMYIYAMRKTLKLHNDANAILSKDFSVISNMSPILDYINKIMCLTKSEFNYIFFTLLKTNCSAENAEINFIITRFEGFTKKTFKKNEKYLPVTAPSYTF